MFLSLVNHKNRQYDCENKLIEIENIILTS